MKEDGFRKTLHEVRVCRMALWTAQAKVFATVNAALDIKFPVLVEWGSVPFLHQKVETLERRTMP